MIIQSSGLMTPGMNSKATKQVNLTDDGNNAHPALLLLEKLTKMEFKLYGGTLLVNLLFGITLFLPQTDFLDTGLR